jgi:hypothetical protein
MFSAVTNKWLYPSNHSVMSILFSSSILHMGNYDTVRPLCPRSFAQLASGRVKIRNQHQPLPFHLPFLVEKSEC